MLNSKAMSAHVPSAIEPAEEIVRHFNRGLAHLRSAGQPFPPLPIVGRPQVRAPQIALLPARRVPRNGLLLSTLLHSALIPLLLSVRIFVAPLSETIAYSAPDSQSDVVTQPVFLPIHAAVSAAGGELPGTGAQGPEMTSALPAAADQTTFVTPKRDYARAQQIVSNPPKATQGVQAILRPDLTEAPQLPYPLRLPGQIMLPAPTIHEPFHATFEHPIERPPKNSLVLEAQALTVENPAAAPVAPESSPIVEPVAKHLAATNRRETDARQATAVVNAVGVPPEPTRVIPDAELASRFLVGPQASLIAALNALRSDQKATRDVEAERSETSAHIDRGNGAAIRQPSGHADARNGTNTTEPLPKSGSGPAAGSDMAPVATSDSLPGIAISGGVSGRRGRVLPTAPILRGSYPLTIISSGSSGGPSRDFGVFARSDTVYTVYIPMADLGAGPDWPIQYALIGPAHNSSSSALLTPPVVLKKIQAVTTDTKLNPHSEPIFIAGIIDESGRLQSLRAVHAADPRARTAVAALAQWEFSAAQLDGEPVAAKVLIGVTVIAAGNVGKQN